MLLEGKLQQGPESFDLRIIPFVHRAPDPFDVDDVDADGDDHVSADAYGLWLVVYRYGRNPILTISSVVWRRQALLDLICANLPDLERLGFAYDWLLYLRAASAGHSAVFVPELLCRHRQHADSFASREDMAWHIAEIRTVHALHPAPAAEWQRAAYLKSLE